MFSHFTLGSNDTARPKTFYDAIIVGKGRLIHMHPDGNKLCAMHRPAS